MKLISQIRPAAQHHQKQAARRSRPPIRWLKAPNTQMLSLVIKTLFMLAVLAIAVHTVTLLAHVTETMTQNVDK